MEKYLIENAVSTKFSYSIPTIFLESHLHLNFGD